MTAAEQRAEALAKSKGVYRAISAVMADMCAEGIGKTRKNQGQGYAFRGVDDVMQALSPSLVKNGLLMLPRLVSRSCDVRPTKNGGELTYTIVEMEYDMVSVEDGTTHTIRTVGEAMDSSDKSSNKAMSAAFKYAALQAFCIPTEGDNDADLTTHEPAPKAGNAPSVATTQKSAVAPGGEVEDGKPWLKSIGFTKEWEDLFEKDCIAMGSTLLDMATECRKQGCKSPSDIREYMDRNR